MLYGVARGDDEMQHITKSFMESGMIDEETNMIPVFDKLMGMCKRWVSRPKDNGVPKHLKDLCRKAFQHLMHVQFEFGQISYPVMKAVEILIGK